MSGLLLAMPIAPQIVDQDLQFAVAPTVVIDPLLAEVELRLNMLLIHMRLPNEVDGQGVAP